MWTVVEVCGQSHIGIRAEFEITTKMEQQNEGKMQAKMIIFWFIFNSF